MREMGKKLDRGNNKREIKEKEERKIKEKVYYTMTEQFFFEEAGRSRGRKNVTT